MVGALRLGTLLVAALVVVGAGRATDPRTHEVEIRGLAFEPSELAVSVGDTIVFTNYDLVPHTVDGAFVGAPDEEGFTSGGLARDARTRLVAGRVGDFEYLCAYHPTMTGRIRVD